jgi:hypothetical protein
MRSLLSAGWKRDVEVLDCIIYLRYLLDWEAGKQYIVGYGTRDNLGVLLGRRLSGGILGWLLGLTPSLKQH